MNTKIICHVDDDQQQRELVKAMFKLHLHDIQIDSFDSFKEFINSSQRYFLNVFDHDTKEKIQGHEMAQLYENSILFSGSYETNLDGPFPIFSKNDLKKLIVYIAERLSR